MKIVKRGRPKRVIACRKRNEGRVWGSAGACL